MENASKALIIAGAILIAILLISVGIMVMNAVNKPIDEAASEANSQAAQIFNTKFTVYEGTNKSMQDIKSLLMAVQASNASDSQHQIIMRRAWTTADSEGHWAWLEPNEMLKELETTQKYKVVCCYSKANFVTTANGAIRRDNNDIKEAMGISTALPSEEGYICIIEIYKQ